MARRASSTMTKPGKPYKPLITPHDRLQAIYERYRQNPSIAHLTYRNRFVSGGGSLEPKVLFVADVPMKAETASGKAGAGYMHVVLEMLTLLGMDVHDIHITHLLKYRPKEQRPLRSSEIAGTRSYLLDEIELLAPAVVVPWGSIVGQLLLPAKKFSMARTHGLVIETDQGTKVAPMFHPQTVLSAPTTRTVLYRDFINLREHV